MNRTIKDATVKAFHYDDLHSLKAHVLAFVTAYNFAKHLKALKWRTPYQVICEAWTKVPAIFKINPHHLIPGPHTWDDTAILRFRRRSSLLFPFEGSALDDSDAPRGDEGRRPITADGGPICAESRTP